MKKTLKIIMVVLSVFILTACGSKKALTDEELKLGLEKQKFSVNDITSAIEDSNIKVVRTANNGVYQIEYYVFKSDNLAKTAYENNVKIFEANKKFKGKKINKKDYQKYVQETDNYYNVVARNKDTLIYVSVNIDNKKDVKKVIKKVNF